MRDPEENGGNAQGLHTTSVVDGDRTLHRDINDTGGIRVCMQLPPRERRTPEYGNRGGVLKHTNVKWWMTFCGGF